MSGWLAGSATTTFDVPIGTHLGGYADRASGSTGTRDALEISAFSLKCGGQDLHIVTADVVAVDSELGDEIADAAGVDARDLLLCATHTHSGPLGVARRLHAASPLTVDHALRSRFVASVAEALTAARKRVQPVTLSVGEVQVESVWTNRTDPDADADHRGRFLAASDERDSLTALLMLIPCHPTVLGAWNLDVSADLHGGVRRAVRERLGNAGGDVTILAATGAAGDISTRFSRRESSFAEVDRLGEIVADAVVCGLERLHPVGSGLRRTTAIADLPMRERNVDDEGRRYDEALAAWNAIEHDPTVSAPEKRRVYTRLQGATILREMTVLPPVRAEILGWRLGGDLAIMSIPGEPFSSCGHLIEQGSPFGTTWVVGYANGYVGYIVDDAAIEAGTYEALASPYGSGADRAVADAAERVLRDLA